MARITEMPHTMRPIWIYDVTYPVGQKWPPHRDDILLVQYSLNKILAKVNLPDVTARSTPGPMGPEYPRISPLKVDGIFGKKSHAALTAYQKETVNNSRCVLADGQADSVYKYLAGAGGDPISPKNMTIMTKVYAFTMYKLSKDILALYGKMIEDHELPTEVQASLRAQKM
jgi:hypothetical protein